MTFFLLGSMYSWYTWLIHLPFLLELVCLHEKPFNHVWKLLQVDACFGCLARSHGVQGHQSFALEWGQLIHRDSDCTLAVSIFRRLLGCISLPVFVGGGFPGGGDGGTCGVWGAVGCFCPWQSFLFLLVAVVLLLMIVPAGYCHFCWSWSVVLLVAILVFC